jgi:hypothetical protein
MTRARQSNIAYVCTDSGLDDEYGPDHEQPTAREVLEQVLVRTGAELSAHETIKAEQERVGSIAQLAAEYDTIAREARRQRWAALTRACFPDTDPAQVAKSDSWPALVAAWRRADAAGFDLDTALPRLAANLPVTGDPLTVLRDRVHRWCDVAAPTALATSALIAGLIPTAHHVTDPDMRRALDERAALIEQRAEALLARAVDHGERWLALLGPPPADPAQRLQWERSAATVAAYRDQHGVTDHVDPFGHAHGGGQWARHADRRRAQTAAITARRLAVNSTEPSQQHVQQPQPELRPDL